MLQTKVLNIMSLCNSGCPSNVLAGAILLNVLYDATIGLLTCTMTTVYRRLDSLQIPQSDLKEIGNVYQGLKTLYQTYLSKVDPALTHDLLMCEEEKI